MFQRVIAGLYGVALIVLGAILLGMEMSAMDQTCQGVWAKLSSNQKSYFSNNYDALVQERTKNVSMCGAFAIIVGFFMFASGVTQHMLFSESAVRWKPPQTSRLPQHERHEKMDFVYVCYRDDDYDGPHTTT